MSLSEAISLVRNGDSVALGGHTLRRHPMAAAAEIVRQGKRDLHVLGWNSGIEFDLLVGAGSAEDRRDLVRRASPDSGSPRTTAGRRESGEIEIREHSEISALDMFRAGASRDAFVASSVLAGTDVPATDPRIATVTDPFTGRPCTAVAAARPDVAIIHAHTADLHGNVQLDGLHWPDNDADASSAGPERRRSSPSSSWSATRRSGRGPERTILPRDAVTCVVEAPYGAYPCACDSRYTYDLSFVGDYYAASASAAAFRRLLDQVGASASTTTTSSWSGWGWIGYSVISTQGGIL